MANNKKPYRQKIGKGTPFGVIKQVHIGNSNNSGKLSKRQKEEERKRRHAMAY